MHEQVQLTPVRTTEDIQAFIRLAYAVYRDDPYWVAPLEDEIKKLLNPQYNVLLTKGPFTFILARRGGRVVGRLGMGIDEKTNAQKGKRDGYICLFECIEDYTVAEAMFDYAIHWLSEYGIDMVHGPISPDKGDDYRGLLVMGYNSSPVLMNSYNPPYYPEFFERYGFTKLIDLYAYHYDLTKELDPRLMRGVAAAKKRYGFDVRPVRMGCLMVDLQAIKQILDEAMPEDWIDLVPPELEELEGIATQFKRLAEPRLINIAWQGSRPIGFALALPDYNQVLKHVRGRLWPLGFLKYFWYRRKITGGRIFVMFVVPDFQKKGVSAAIYLETLLAAQRMGYTYGEGSTIGEINGSMRRDAEGVGGVHYKTYRMYELKV